MQNEAVSTFLDDPESDEEALSSGYGYILAVLPTANERDHAKEFFKRKLVRGSVVIAAGCKNVVCMCHPQLKLAPYACAFERCGSKHAWTYGQDAGLPAIVEHIQNATR